MDTARILPSALSVNNERAEAPVALTPHVIPKLLFIKHIAGDPKAERFFLAPGSKPLNASFLAADDCSCTNNAARYNGLQPNFALPWPILHALLYGPQGALRERNPLNSFWRSLPPSRRAFRLAPLFPGHQLVSCFCSA